MKLLHFLVPALLLSACIDRQDTYTEYTPVLLKRTDLEKSITMENARPIKDAGKIYRKGNLLFINEKYEGVHVYNNADPKNPVALGFIKIPGNVDITINNDIIYADNAVDLVALRYANDKVQVLDRDREVFPEIVAPDFGDIPEQYTVANRPENTVIIKWEKL